MSTPQESPGLPDEFKQEVDQASEEELVQIISDIMERMFWYYHERGYHEDDYFHVLGNMLNQRNHALHVLRDKFDRTVKFGELVSEKTRARWARLNIRRHPLYELSESGEEVLNQFDPNGEEEIDRIEARKDALYELREEEKEMARRREIRQEKLQKAGEYLKELEKSEDASNLSSILKRLTDDE
jgi:hypothetical protein